METFCADSILRGYHIYKDIPWEPAIGTILPCEREAFNLHDPYAVAAMNHGVVVGHVSRSISALCSIFLRRRVICCEIIGTRQHSSDLPQGGLELPCKLNFSAASKEITKIRKLLTQVPKSDEVTNSNTSASPPKLTTVEVKSSHSVKEPPASSKLPSVEMKYGCDSVNETPASSELASVEIKSVNEPLASTSKLTSVKVISDSSSVNKPTDTPGASILKDNILVTLEPEDDVSSEDTEPATKKLRIDDNSAETVWLKLEKNMLTWYDKEVFCSGMELNDHHINYCQSLLKKQFPLIGGLLLTLLQNKPIKQKLVVDYKLLIVMKETTGLWHPGLILVIALLKFMIHCTSLFTKKLLQLFKTCSKR